MTGTTYTYSVLDSSASMASCSEATVMAYNAALEQLANTSKALSLRTKAGLILFGDRVLYTGIKVPLAALNASSAKKLQLKPGDFQPYGNTPLYDGIGLAINELGSIPLGLDDAVLVSIFTDGYENDSRKWLGPILSPTIRALQNTGRWTFTFAGANVDLEQMSQVLGINRGNMLLYESTNTGTQTMSHEHNAGLGNYMMARSSGGQSVADFYSTTNAFQHAQVGFNQSDQIVGQQLNVDASPRHSV